MGNGDIASAGWGSGCTGFFWLRSGQNSKLRRSTTSDETKEPNLQHKAHHHEFRNMSNFVVVVCFSFPTPHTLHRQKTLFVRLPLTSTGAKAVHVSPHLLNAEFHVIEFTTNFTIANNLFSNCLAMSFFNARFITNFFVSCILQAGDAFLVATCVSMWDVNVLFIPPRDY